MEEKRMEEILGSLNGVDRAEAPPYLYSKLRNRLQPAETVSPRLAWRLVTALVIVAALNVLTLRLLGNTETTTTADAQGVASEYAISLPQTY